jgi:hypothetical protein
MLTIENYGNVLFAEFMGIYFFQWNPKLIIKNQNNLFCDVSKESVKY